MSAKSIFLLLLILICESGFAQTKVDILKADKLVGRNSSKGQIRLLQGHVKIRIENNILESDSALHFVDLNEIRAYGRVYIQGEKEQIWADSAIYNSKTDLSFFFGKLIIEKDSSRFFSTKASYSFPLKTAYFTESLQLEDSKGVLRADRGIYFSDIDSASFRGNVQLSDSTLYVEADSLLSNRSKEQYELFGNVFAYESAKFSYVDSDYMYLDSLGSRILKGNSTLIKIDSAKTDTIIIRAQHIDYKENTDSTYSFKARENVSIWSTKFSSYSDSARYNSVTEEFKLTSNAFVWNKRLQLSAPKINIDVKDDTIRSIHAFPKPFAVQTDSITNRFHQMKGDSLFALFKDGIIKTVTFNPNAQVAFFSTNEEDKPDGLMVVESKSVDLFFENSELVDLNASKDIKATYSEESTDLELYRLEGFVWEPELRPHKIEIPTAEREKLTKKEVHEYPKHHPLFKKKSSTK